MNQIININSIKPNPFQSRDELNRDTIRLLADEIKQRGYWSRGLRARKVDGHLELISGHRRLEALKMLGYKEVDIEIVEVNDQQALLDNLVENVQREGLSDLVKAKLIKQYLDYESVDSTVEKLAELLGLSVHTIRDFRRLAELDMPTQKAAAKAGMSRTTIRVADALGGPEFIKVAAEHKLSRSELEEIQKEVVKAPAIKQVTLREKLKAGKIIAPKQARREVRRLMDSSSKSEQAKFYAEAYIGAWTGQFEDIVKRIKEMMPFKKDLKEHFPKDLAKFASQLDKLYQVGSELVK